jgi:hypothetical protein
VQRSVDEFAESQARAAQRELERASNQLTEAEAKLAAAVEARKQDAQAAAAQRAELEARAQKLQEVADACCFWCTYLCCQELDAKAEGSGKGQEATAKLEQQIAELTKVLGGLPREPKFFGRQRTLPACVRLWSKLRQRSGASSRS